MKDNTKKSSRQAAHYDMTSFHKRLFPQTLEAVTPSLLVEITEFTQATLATLHTLNLIDVVITTVDHDVIIKLRGKLDERFHFQWLLLMMNRFHLVMYDLYQEDDVITYRFYQRP